MSTQGMYQASRDLHRASMNEYGPKLEWLADPELVPEDVIHFGWHYGDEKLEKQCASLALWMVEQLGDWAVRVHEQVDVGKIYDDRNLGLKERAFTMLKFQHDPYTPYKPGMFAVASIFAAIPYVAERQERPKEDWTAIGAAAEAFGSDISRHGTDVQASIIQWMRADSPRGENTINVAKLKLDEQTGLTTTTPFADVLGSARRISAELNLTGVGESPCIAHQARSPVEGSRSLFGAVWSSYAQAAGRLIYPDTEIDPAQVLPEEEPWEFHDIADYMSKKLVEDHEEMERQFIF